MALLLSPFDFLIFPGLEEISGACRNFFGDYIRDIAASNKKKYLSITFKRTESLQKRATTIETSGSYGRKGFKAFFYFWNVEARSGRDLEVSYLLGKKTGAPAVVEGVMRFLISYEVASRGGMALHASSFEVGGRSFLFCARSGGGKSTISSLFGNGRILSDDFSVISRRENGGFEAMGSVFTGREKQKCMSGSFPLAGIYFLRKSKMVECRDMEEGAKIRELLKSVFFYGGGAGLEKKLLSTAEDIVKGVKCRELEFNMVDSPVPLL